MEFPWESQHGSATGANPKALEPRAPVLSVSGTGALCVGLSRSLYRAPALHHSQLITKSAALQAYA